MDQITFPTDVPPELKAADLILKRAKELKAHDAVMCYWCPSPRPSPLARPLAPRRLTPALPACSPRDTGCYRAAQIGVADKQTHEGTLVLLDLLDALEKVGPPCLLACALGPPTISSCSCALARPAR